MRPSGPISLFSERPQSSPPTASVVLSIAAHFAVIGLVTAGIIFRPRIKEVAINPRETVRHLDLHMPDPQIRRSMDAALHAPGPKSGAKAKPLENKLDVKPVPDAPRPAVAELVAQKTPAQQTLLQPKLPPRVLPEKVMVPTVVLWSMDNTKSSTIVAPLPKTVTAAVVHPSPDPPNNEPKLDSVSISSTALASKTQTILPSTTSPLVVLAQQQAQTPPQTTSKSDAQPSPAAVISLSEYRKEGIVVLPDANQSAPANASGGLAAGKADDSSRSDQGAGKSDATGKTASSSNVNNASSSPNQGDKTDVAVGQAAVSAATGSSSVERIVLPKDGQFGVVVVGSSLEEKFPEASELWSGRLAYTVYLHVGLSKSWILQYALPAATEAAAGGNAGHLAAPWPYTIIRPNLTMSELNADALMIHGIVNAAGHFEALAVAFPPKYSQAEFVISSLRQWEFRPAMQGGQATPVEVVLIIPEEPE